MSKILQDAIAGITPVTKMKKIYEKDENGDTVRDSEGKAVVKEELHDRTIYKLRKKTYLDYMAEEGITKKMIDAVDDANVKFFSDMAETACNMACESGERTDIKVGLARGRTFGIGCIPKMETTNNQTGETITKYGVLKAELKVKAGVVLPKEIIEHCTTAAEKKFA